MTTEQKIQEILDDNVFATNEEADGSGHWFVTGKDDALKEISSLIPKWRKVEEELPETGKDILFLSTSDQEFGVLPGRFYPDLKLFTDFILDRQFRIDQVKCWMYESELLNLIPK